MIVYRIENADGYGPYSIIRRRVLRALIGRKHGSMFTTHIRPMPENDGIDMKGDTTLVCGFKTMTQLKRWFTPRDLRVLAQEGFYVTTYETTSVLLGNKQVMFHKSTTLAA